MNANTGRWEDMGLYCAWRGAGQPDVPAPTKRDIVYADVVLPSGKHSHRIACAVIEGGRRCEVCADEIKKIRATGCQVVECAT